MLPAAALAAILAPGFPPAASAPLPALAGLVRPLGPQADGNKAFRRTVTADPRPSPKYSAGNLAILTDGVRGAKDFRQRWVGWEGVDFDLAFDAGAPVSEVSIATLWDPRNGILHPQSVTCFASMHGDRYQGIQTQRVEGDQRTESVTRTFTFNWALPATRFIKLHIEGTKTLPAWHASAGAPSWVFVDEVTVR